MTMLVSSHFINYPNLAKHRACLALRAKASSPLMLRLICAPGVAGPALLHEVEDPCSASSLSSCATPARCY